MQTHLSYVTLTKRHQKYIFFDDLVETESDIFDDNDLKGYIDYFLSERNQVEICNYKDNIFPKSCVLNGLNHFPFTIRKLMYMN